MPLTKTEKAAKQHREQHVIPTLVEQTPQRPIRAEDFHEPGLKEERVSRERQKVQTRRRHVSPKRNERRTIQLIPKPGACEVKDSPKNKAGDEHQVKPGGTVDCVIHP